MSFAPEDVHTLVEDPLMRWGTMIEALYIVVVSYFQFWFRIERLHVEGYLLKVDISLSVCQLPVVLRIEYELTENANILY